MFDRDRLLAGFEVQVAEVCGHLNALSARLVALTAEALECEWWVQSGVKSPEHWLCWQTGVSASHARRLVAAARRRVELPVTMAAFDAGELSFDQLAPIVERAPGWADAAVCELAVQCTVSQIRAAVGRYPFPDVPGVAGVAGQPVDEQPAAGGEVTDRDGARHPDDPGPVAPPADREQVTLTNLDDGSWRLSGRLDADHGLIVDAAMREIADALFRGSGSVASGADVLAEMAHRSLATVTDHSRRDRYRVHVLVDERRELVDPFGHTLPAWIRDLITCDTTMAVTWTRHGVPIAQGSTADTIPPATRRHVVARDHGCRVPGCGTTRRLDVHHVIHRADHGTNDPHNLVAICPRHHRMHHRGRLGIRGNADQPDNLEFTDANGRPIATNQLIRPPTGPPPPPSSTYQHPLGERLDLRWVYFHPPPAA